MKNLNLYKNEILTTKMVMELDRNYIFEFLRLCVTFSSENFRNPGTWALGEF